MRQVLEGGAADEGVCGIHSHAKSSILCIFKMLLITGASDPRISNGLYKPHQGFVQMTTTETLDKDEGADMPVPDFVITPGFVPVLATV